MRIARKSREVMAFLKAANIGERVVIVLHDNPDPDCIAAGFVLKRLFESQYGRKVQIAYRGLIGRAENRRMVELIGVAMERLNVFKPDAQDFVVSVDCQPGSGNSILGAEARVDLILDHHPRRRTARRAGFADIRHGYGATSTIALEYLMLHGLEPTRLEATALFYAIKTETQDLGREACPADRRAYFHLFRKIDFALLSEILQAQVPRDYFIMLNRALENATVHSDVLITALGDIEAAEHVAEVADMLLRLKNIGWTFVTGRAGGALYLSMRTRYRDVDAGRLMQKLLHGLGSGGGHEMMAGGRIDAKDMPHSVEVLESDLSARLLKLLKKRALGSGLLPEEGKEG